MAKNKKDDNFNIPDEALQSLARILLPGIQAYFESEEGQREYAEWEREQERNAA